MKDSQLVKLLWALTDQQWVQLEKFLKSPFYNEELEKESSISYRLFMYLRSEKEGVESTGLHRDLVAKNLAEYASLPKIQLDKVMSGLNKLVKRFLAVTNNPLLTRLNPDINFGLLQFYQDKGMNDRHAAESQKFRVLNKQSGLEDEHTLFESFCIERSVLEFEYSMNQRIGDVNLIATINALDIYYLTVKSRLTSLLLQQSKFVELPEQPLINFEDLIRIKKASSKEIIIAEAYLQAIELLTSNVSKEFIEKYKVMLDDISQKANTVDLQNLYGFLRNYYTARYNRGDNEYLATLHDFHKELIGKSVIFDNDKLHHSTFSNIILVGLKIRDYDWVKGFLDENKEKISGHPNSSEVYRFNSANYYFHIQDFNEAWELLQWNFVSAHYKRAAKKIELKILYEQKEYSLLDSRMNAFKVYLSRSSTKIISLAVKQVNNAFVNYLSQILSPNTLHNPARIKKIKERILAQKAVAEREWLLEKIEELLQK